MRVILMSLLMCLVAVTVYAEVPPKPDMNTSIHDYSNVLDEATKQEMQVLIDKVEADTSNEVMILTLETLGGIETLEFGQQLLQKWEIGGETGNGMVMFATTGQGEGNNAVWISVGPGLEALFYEPEIERIIDKYMIDDLADGDYSTAFYDTLLIMSQEILGEIEDADPYGEDDWFWWLVLIAIVLFMLWVIFYLGPKYGSGSGDSYYDYDSGGSSGGGYGGGSSDGGGSGRSF